MNKPKQTWNEIEEEFEKKFLNENINDSRSPINSKYWNGGIGKMMKDIPAFFKQKFQQNLHDEAVAELENVDNTNTKL